MPCDCRNDFHLTCEGGERRRSARREKKDEEEEEEESETCRNSPAIFREEPATSGCRTVLSIHWAMQGVRREEEKRLNSQATFAIAEGV